VVKTPWVSVSSHHYTLWMIRVWCKCYLPSPLGSCSKRVVLSLKMNLASIYVIIPLPFWHKLNYFLFCLKVQLLRFELQTLHDIDFKLSQSKHITMSHNRSKTLFIIWYNNYLWKFSKLKNQVPKLRFQI